jgi:hypothetical protein
MEAVSGHVSRRRAAVAGGSAVADASPHAQGANSPLPNLTDPVSLQGKSTGKQPEVTGITNKDKQPEEEDSHHESNYTYSTTTVVLLTRKCKLQFVFRQLMAMTAQCRISTLELRSCGITGPHARWLAGTLVHLDLSENRNFGAVRTESLAGVLAQCPALAHLNLRFNNIRAAGAESPAGVMEQCSTLAHLDLNINQIKSFTEVVAQCRALTHLRSLRQWDRSCRGMEASSFVSWSVLWSLYAL